MNTEDFKAGSFCSPGMSQKSEFVSLIKFHGVPILPPVLTDMQREEMRQYRHRAAMLESKLRASSRHKMLVQLQASVREINEQYCSVPVISGDLHGLESEFGHIDIATNVPPDKVMQSMSLSTECHEPDTASASDHRQLTNASLIDTVESDYKHDQHHREERDQTPALVDSVTDDEAVNVSGVLEQEHGQHAKIVSPSLASNTVTESDFDAVVSSGCLSVSVSYSSPDSGVYSKVVSNSLITPRSTVTESLDLTTDLLNSSVDRSLGLNVLSAWDMPYSKNGGLGQHHTVCETLPSCTELVQSIVDSDDSRTLADVRSSIISASTDDETNQTIVGTDGPEMPGELSLSFVPHTANIEDSKAGSHCSPNMTQKSDFVSSEQVEYELEHEQLQCKHEQSELIGVSLPADRTVSCPGSQDLSGPSDSDMEDDAVLKTVIAVRTKAAIPSEKCVDLIKPFELDEDLEQELQNSSRSIQLSPSVIHSLAVEEHVSDMDNSGIECSTLRHTVDCLQGDSAAGPEAEHLKGTDIAADLVGDRNPVESSPAIIVHISTLTSERASQADTSFESQVLSVAAVDSQQLLEHKATVKLFSEDEDLRVKCSGRKSHSRTRSFTIANSFLPLSQSCSPDEFTARSDTRRHSYAVSSPQPLDAVEHLDLCLEQQGREVWKEDEITLTSSMVDLKLKPSKKRLDFDSLLPDFSQSYFLEPPDGYRDEPVLMENVGSFISSGAVGDAQPPELNVQAKNDHLQRYLESLAAMPGCDSVHDVLDNQDSKLLSRDISYSCELDREGGIELPYHEHSTSLLIPDLLSRSENAENVTENVTDDECVELQLQQYEVMKRQLMEEHRRSLELLLLEQERQMALLKSRMMGQTAFSRSLHSTVTDGRSPSALAIANSDFELFKDKPLPTDVPDTLDRWNSINEMQLAGNCVLGQHVSSPDQHIAAVVAGEVSSIHKRRSPAGVFYSDEPVVSYQRSCSTIPSDDAESEFAYSSPAVLRNSRRLTPKCSPQNISMAALDQSLHSVLQTQSSMAVDHLTLHAPTSNRRYVDMFSEPVPDDIQQKCEKLSAVVKGYLTRRLFRTERVRSIIKTIWDTAEFALQFQMESPIKKGHYSTHDRFVHERVLAQLNSAIYDFHEIFFDIPVAERMQYIAQERAIERERRYKSSKENSTEKSRRISAATVKSIERRKKIADTLSKPDAASKLSRVVENPNRVRSYTRHSADKVVRPSRFTNSARKPLKGQIQRIVMREKSHVADRSSTAAGTSATRPRIVCRQNKPPKRNSGDGRTLNPSPVKPLRKIAPASSSASSATKIPLRRDSNSKLSPTAGPVIDVLSTAVTLPSAKPTSSFVTSQHSVNRVHSNAVGCGSTLTLTNAHKLTVASKSG